MASGLYDRGATNLANGTVDWDAASGAGDLRVLLATTSYTPSKGHNTVSQITNELSGSGYLRKALASKTVTQDGSGHAAVLDAADLTWTALTAAAVTGAGGGTLKYAIVYWEGGGTDATRELVGYVDLDSGSGIPAPNGGDYTVAWNAGGLFKNST